MYMYCTYSWRAGFLHQIQVMWACIYHKSLYAKSLHSLFRYYRAHCMNNHACARRALHCAGFLVYLRCARVNTMWCRRAAGGFLLAERRSLSLSFSPTQYLYRKSCQQHGWKEGDIRSMKLINIYPYVIRHHCVPTCVSIPPSPCGPDMLNRVDNKLGTLCFQHTVCPCMNYMRVNLNAYAVCSTSLRVYVSRAPRKCSFSGKTSIAFAKCAGVRSLCMSTDTNPARFAWTCAVMPALGCCSWPHRHQNMRTQIQWTGSWAQSNACT